MKTIIYYRKSTDRDDKQANTLEHQLNNCRNTARNLGFEVIREIGESVSAKEEFKRPGFNEMIDICKKGKIDFIIIDEPKRLSRNNIDTSRIIDLMDKGQIKGIYATSRQYLGDNARDKFLLQLDLSLSKMDNEDRAKDTRDKMLTCVKNGKCMTKVPFGYKNITIRKGHKDVIVDESLREVIKLVFNLRIKEYTFNQIGDYIQKYYPHIKKIGVQHIYKILNNKFYYGIMTFSGLEYPGNHEPIISKEIFDKAGNAGKGTFEYKNIGVVYPLKGLLKDPSGIKLHAYTKKGNFYYASQSRSGYKVSINENIVFEKAGEYLKQLGIWSNLAEFNKIMIEDKLKHKRLNNDGKIEDINSKIQTLNNRKSELLNLRLDGTIDNVDYKIKLNEITVEMFGLEESKSKILKNGGDIGDLFKKMTELAGGLYTSYINSDINQRALILKNTLTELLIDNKKELVFKENELFNVIKMLFFSFGSATENRTPVYGMKTRCPNH